jgi:hypothetical protein
MGIFSNSGCNKNKIANIMYIIQKIEHEQKFCFFQLSAETGPAPVIIFPVFFFHKMRERSVNLKIFLRKIRKRITIDISSCKGM